MKISVLLLLPFLSHALKLQSDAEGCGPARGLFQISAKGNILLETESSEGGDLPKFYLHEKFVNFDSMLACYHKKKHTTPGVDEMDHHVMPDTAEHLVDIWLLDQMRKHPQRVDKPEQADFHVVGAPIFLSYAAARFQKCGNHEQRMMQMVKGMKSSKFFAKKKFVVIATAPDALRVLTPPVMQLAQSGSVILATADKDYKSVKPFPRKIVIPYKSHYKLEENAWDESKEIPDTAHRSVSFMFHGDIKKGKRAILQSLKQKLPDSNIQDHDFQNIGQNGMNKIGDESANTYLNSKFCLIAEGSTPTSRRLFDALAGGCVPVMMGGIAGLQRNMPFTKTINWQELAFFGGDLDCVKSDLGGTATYLNKLLQEPEEKISEMRKKGRKVFTGALSYKGPGIVDAMLRELKTV